MPKVEQGHEAGIGRSSTTSSARGRQWMLLLLGAVGIVC
jgi:hypothetical protein